jgi:uncharacterized protein YndB with AHSA1/START domain
VKIELAIDIHATPEEVWYWLGDPERAKSWMTSVGRTEYIIRTPELIGSTFREYVQEDGCGTWMSGEIRAYVPNRDMAFHLEGDYNIVEVAFSLEESGGITRLTQTANMRFKGLLRLASLVSGRAIKGNIARQSLSELAALKALCEAGDHGP